jgi:hypothetical protein
LLTNTFITVRTMKVSRESSAGRMRRATLVAALLCVALAGPAAALTGVGGTVRYYNGGGIVPDVTVVLDGPGQMSTSTDTAGTYAFGDPGLGDWQVVPTKLGDAGTGISTLDASFALQEVVGLRDFTDHQRLACDVTGDGTVSSLDAARILQLVAGLREQLPAAETCGSDWVFVPDPADAPNQHVVTPQMSPMCLPGAIDFEPLAPPIADQDFIAILLGDCTGNWQAAAEPTATPTVTDTPAATATATPPSTATASFTATATSPPTATATVPPPTATRTLPPPTATNTAPPPPTNTPPVPSTNTATSTVTRTGTRTQTPSVTVTSTPPSTNTRTSTPTRTPTRSQTPTRTQTITLTPTVTVTSTGTRTGTRTQTPTFTPTASPSPTQTCISGLAWNVSSAHLVSQQSGGDVWLSRTVPTDFGWGVFWLRNDPGASTSVKLYYAHVDFSGQVTVAPMLLVSIPKISFRSHYYMAAWNDGHYGVFTAEQGTLFYQSVSLEGAVSQRHAVGPPLFVDPNFDQEADGDVEVFPGGFMVVVEGECSGHSCSYAFKVNTSGTPTSTIVNLVDFDLTHQFFPTAAYDGSGFAMLSVKDITIPNGGVMTKYWSPSGAIDGHEKVVPAKQYQWDEFPDMAFNGNHFAAIWTENSQRSHASPWQIHFASFHRPPTSSMVIANRVIDVHSQKTNHKFSTQVHAMGGDWVAQYASRDANGAVVAVFELLGDDAQTGIYLEPFPLTADSLGSSRHSAAAAAGVLGIARGSNINGGTTVEFYTLAPPSCQ